MSNYKQKDELPNLYNILGLSIDVCDDPKCNELIKSAYVRKAKICHPDKHPGRKDVIEVFELITSAYDILKDEKQRTKYNHKLSLDKQCTSDFTKLKKSATSYAESFGEYTPPDSQQKLAFKTKMQSMDEAHGFDSKLTEPISKFDAKEKMVKLSASRTEQDKNLKPEKLFDGDVFDIKKFNEAFDAANGDSIDSIINHSGVPSAWNDFGSALNYSSFDSLDSLYVDDADRVDTSNQTYGSVSFGTVPKKITKEDVAKMAGADYVDGHSTLGDDYYQDLKAKLRDRKSITTDFEEMKYKDFKRDDTAGYGIFDQLGMKFDDRLALDVEEDDISKRYEKLMAERQRDIMPPPPTMPMQRPKPKDSR